MKDCNKLSKGSSRLFTSLLYFTFERKKKHDLKFRRVGENVKSVSKRNQNEVKKSVRDKKS
jgi:predicted SprT family Zn-dependent metalloprotease